MTSLIIIYDFKSDFSELNEWINNEKEGKASSGLLKQIINI